ncbi:MAG: cobalt ECF transporter T component CbiQ [Rhodospirillaceae bacterium]|nr:cobalt ECF transporter T component CbiQ [Rhodospirillaceae bacterium]
MAHNHSLLPGPLVAEELRDLFAGIDPRVRLVAACLFCLACVALGGFPALVMGLVIALAALVAARPPVRVVLRRMMAVEGFMLLILVMLPFTVPPTGAGDVLLSWGGLTASGSGLMQAARIILKTTIVVLTLTALVARLEPLEFGRALAGLGCPAKLVTLLVLTVRYFDVLRRDLIRLRRSMQVRGFRARANWHSLRSVGYLIGMLLVRSFDRSERIIAAMRCRGFTGAFPLDRMAPLSPQDFGFAVMAACAAIACLILDHAPL